MAARMYLVFRPLSSRVSPRQPHRICGPHGVSLCAFFRVFSPEAMGGFAQYSASKALCTVERLACLFPQSKALSLDDHARRSASHACRAAQCCNTVTSRADLLHGEECHGSLRYTPALSMELGQWSIPYSHSWTGLTWECVHHQHDGLAAPLTLVFSTRTGQYQASRWRHCYVITRESCVCV